MKPLDVSPKVSAAALAGSLVTVIGCVAKANGVTLDPGVLAASVVIISSIFGYLAPHISSNKIISTLLEGEKPQ